MFCTFANTTSANELDLNITDSTTEKYINQTVYGNRNQENLYLRIYESAKKDINTKSFERLSVQSGFSQADIQMALEGRINDSLKKKCERLFQLNTSQSLYNCLSTLKENYLYEKNLIAFETRLKGESMASEIWSDGDLSNSFFDVVVDLNIIEIILFGENTYEYPFSDNYDFSDDEDDEDNIGDQEDSDDSDEDSDEDNEVTDDEDSGEDDNTDEGVEVCQDPDAINIGEDIWIPDSNLNTGSGSELTNNIDSNNSDNPYLGGEYQFSDDDDDCDGTSLFQGLLCVDPWPCDKFFCIKVSFIPQKVGNGDSRATSVQEIVTVGLEQLNFLKGHTLTVRKNSNERFIPSVSKFFDRPIGLDVITQSIPIKLKPKKSAFDDEDKNGELNILGKFVHRIGEEVGIFPKDNHDFVLSEADRTINMATEKKDLQKETHDTLVLNTKQLYEKIEKIREEWKKAEKIKYTQSFWEEFRTYLNIFVLYFESMKEAFLKLETTGTEILDEVGQSCN